MELGSGEPNQGGAGEIALPCIELGWCASPPPTCPSTPPRISGRPLLHEEIYLGFDVGGNAKKTEITMTVIIIMEVCDDDKKCS